MPRFQDFLDLPSWTQDDLDRFLALDHQEGHNVEYKQSDWLLDKSPTPTVNKSRYNDLREYAAGISTTGGGLMFLGIPERTRGQPGIPDGVPKSAWGGSRSPVEVLSSVLWNGIHPRLFPPPQIHLVPLRSDPTREVIVMNFPAPLHRYYRVLHGGGFVPIRFGDGLQRAPPGLEAALAGDRGMDRPVIELRPFSDPEIDAMRKDYYELAARVGPNARYPFVIANHGLASLRSFRIGIVTSYKETKQSEYGFFGRRMEEKETQANIIPRPLQGVIDVERPLIRLIAPGVDLSPTDNIEMWIGIEVADPIMLRNSHFVVWVSGEGIEPIVQGYRISRVDGGVFPSELKPLNVPFRFGH